MQPQFTKFHGLGNDYLVIEAEQLSDVKDLGEFARRICNRHYGAGGDGIAIIAQSETDDADFNCRIFNPDGSEAGLSGNGTRCAVAYLYYKDLWSKDELRLSTKTGLKRYFPRADRPAPGKFLFESELGQPKFDTRLRYRCRSRHRSIRLIGYPLPVNGESFPVTAMQMGNPNCCIFVDDFDALNWRADRQSDRGASAVSGSNECRVCAARGKRFYRVAHLGAWRWRNDSFGYVLVRGRGRRDGQRASRSRRARVDGRRRSPDQVATRRRGCDYRNG